MSELFDARAILRVKSPREYKDKQLKSLADARKLGFAEAREQIITNQIMARIEHNRWLIDCECGSGVAVHPDWPEARCLDLGCGRVYTNVQIPANRGEIERELRERPRLQDRNFNPITGDTIETLRRHKKEQGKP